MEYMHMFPSDDGHHISRRLAIIAFGVSVGFIACGCPGGAAEPERLRLGGTGMTLATMRRIAEAFVSTAPGTTVEVLPSLGSAGGIAAVAAGAIDLGLSARALTPAERGKGLRERAYARTPIAFVTHPAKTRCEIGFAQVIGILAGTLTTWPDGTPVRLVRREPSDADWIMLQDLSPDFAAAVAVARQRPGLLTATTDQENADMLERLHGSFGMISIGQLRAENRQLAPFALDGVRPEPEALAGGRYKLARTLRVIWRDLPGRGLSAFLDFLQGPQAHDILTRLGHLSPVDGVS
ncbi:substrate-binding domain-containing protein [Rhodovastum atsumiense]